MRGDRANPVDVADERGVHTGYKGSGGGIGLADPNQGYTIAFTHNRLTAPPHDSALHIPDRIRTALRPTNCPRATETGI